MHTELHSKPVARQSLGFAATPLLLLAALIAAVVIFVMTSNRQAADGPREVIWDKTPCAYCAMHVGDPRFAAQLSTADGTTYFYDDPGCLFLHRGTFEASAIHAQWFRNMEQDGWLEAREAAFQRCEDTPMNFGFGAVPLGSPASVSLDVAAAEVLAQ